jgi:hypothetical protein
MALCSIVCRRARRRALVTPVTIVGRLRHRVSIISRPIFFAFANMTRIHTLSRMGIGCARAFVLSDVEAL